MPYCLIFIVALLLVVSSKADVAQETNSTLAPAHEYQVIIDESLKLLHIRAQLLTTSNSIRLGDRHSVRNIRRLRHCDSDKSLQFRRSTITSSVSCIEYSVALRKSSSSSRWQQSYAGVKDTVSSPKNWMLMPPGEEAFYRVSFDAPDGVEISVPWRPTKIANTFEFRRYSLSSDAITAFGRFDKQIVPVAGGELRVSQLTTRHPVNADKMIKWLESAAHNVSQAHGNFPLRSTQVIVVPVNSTATEPVPFGRVIRDGGEAVQFFVDTELSLDSFINDWTATHEFSHLLMPYVGDRWVSEGFASYYQNVLMAKGGVYTAEKAWRKLFEGFQRGRRAAPGRSPRTATMRNGGLMKVYWSGAAIALMADVQLRKLSDGEESLATVFRRLRFCCLPSVKVYTDKEFFAELDRLSPHKIFVDLYEDYANSGVFPETEALFEELGVRIERGRAKLYDSQHDDIRDAIME